VSAEIETNGLFSSKLRGTSGTANCKNYESFHLYSSVVHNVCVFAITLERSKTNREKLCI